MNRSIDGTASQVELKNKVERAAVMKSVDVGTAQFYNQLNQLLYQRQELARYIMTNRDSDLNSFVLFEEYNKKLRELLAL